MRTVATGDRGGTNTRGSTLAIGLMVAALFALPESAQAKSGDFCSATARAQREACGHDVADNRLTQRAVCLNLADPELRKECFAELRAARDEGLQLCREQHDARRAICDSLGEGRYEPDFGPVKFDDDFTSLTNPNPYFPLAIGDRWQYTSGGETDTVEVLDKTKLIEGVTCIVTSDVVDGPGTRENTLDWFGQAKDGAVFYCGESVQALATFPGDVPQELELVDIEGSWKAGRDGARPGTIFLSNPSVGAIYRQEWLPGTAEDVAVVVSTSYGFGTNPDLDVLVPEDLATLLCADDCVVTNEFSALDPGPAERKYWAPGIGLFLEVTPETGEVNQLTDCNFDAKCALLPTP